MEEKSSRMGVDNISKLSVYSDVKLDRVEELLNKRLILDSKWDLDISAPVPIVYLVLFHHSCVVSST